MSSVKNLRICDKGHKYYKSSDCPVCPVCANEEKPDSFLKDLVAPARRALQNKGIFTLEHLANHTKEEILALHGMGRATMPKLAKALTEKGLDFKKIN